MVVLSSGSVVVQQDTISSAGIGRPDTVVGCATEFQGLLSHVLTTLGLRQSKNQVQACASGSSPAFVVPLEDKGASEQKLIVKFFPDFIDNHAAIEHWNVEMAALRLVAEAKQQQINDKMPHCAGFGNIPDREGLPEIRYTAYFAARGAALKQHWAVLSEEERSTIVKQAAEFLARLHCIQVERQAIPAECAALNSDALYHTLSTNFERLLAGEKGEEIIADTEIPSIWSTLSVGTLAEVRDYLQRHEVQFRAFLSEVKSSACLLHGDLHWEHIFVNRQGDRPLAFLTAIDWDDAVLFHPTYELVKVHLSSLRGDPTRLEHFIDFYAAAGQDVAPDYKSHMLFLTLVHRFNPLHFIASEEQLNLQEFSFQELARKFWGLEVE